MKPRPLAIKPITAPGEAEKRYREALGVLSRIVAANNRHHYEDGESLDESIAAAQEILDCESLELEIFGTPETNPDWPAPKPEAGDA